ncbi:ABC transporter substrate-binding protein [Actinobacillus delphinicola]|uniref:Oligopeptide ABC transporter periplasmic oligopeptide-binding protein n=1 Tax=Actinobacillus delphinicola TaxID=51161 RepID=A0A448TSC8_9PAST|nr:ABC transporter substrate-binding protein [Actinobacillus delphinicola]VEJ08902.1 oligopeptide ABC transporter periplasmic oligopeptide-binding protein [Actinobacillus delphinicola]
MRLFNRKITLSVVVSSVFLGINPFLWAENTGANAKLSSNQTVRWNIGADPASLDPHKIEGVPEGHVAQNIFETLVVSDNQGHLLPGVAERWEHNDDYTVWTFYLRPDAKWSNGDPVTANDFVYAFRRLADPQTASPYASYLTFLKLKNAEEVISGKKSPENLGVTALDNNRLQLNLSQSIPYADELLEYYSMVPLNQKVVEKYGDAWTKPENIVTNGPFKPSNWIVNEKIELAPNPYYWDAKNVKLKQVILYPIASANTDVDRYRSGGIDITGGALPVDLFNRLKKDYPNQVYTPKTLCTYYYEINNKRAPFNNRDVRLALSMALDRNIITNKVMGQGQQVTYTFTPNYINGGEKIKNPEWASWTQAERNQKAIELLEKAGYSSANPLTFNLLYNTSENHKRIAIAASAILRQNLKGLVRVKLENQEWKTYLDSRHQGNYDVARAGWCADYNDASSFLNYFLSHSTTNSSFYHNKFYDEAVAQSYRAKTNTQRAEDYAKAEAILDQDVAVIPIFNSVNARMIKPYVKGFDVDNPANNYYLKNVYIEEH